MTFAKDSRDLLIECCVEFITLISSEANEIAEKDAKKTIACEHVKAALEELDFGDYVPAILEVAQDYKKQQQARPRSRNYSRPSANHGPEPREEADQDRAERHDRRAAYCRPGRAFQDGNQQIQRATSVKIFMDDLYE